MSSIADSFSIPLLRCDQHCDPHCDPVCDPVVCDPVVRDPHCDPVRDSLRELLGDLVAIDSINPYRTFFCTGSAIDSTSSLGASSFGSQQSLHFVPGMSPGSSEDFKLAEPSGPAQSFRPKSEMVRELGLGNEAKINRYLEKKLRELGFRVERQVFQPATRISQQGIEFELPERANIIAEKGFGEKSLLLYAHTDTTDVKCGWKHDPFVLTESRINNRLRWSGLGALDLKSGIAAILAAASADPPPGWKLKVAFLADEEFWSFGAAHILQHPFVSDVKLALVPEIAEGGSADWQWIGLGRLGRTEIQIDIYGHSCHGAEAELHPHAVNAVHQGAHILSALARYSERSRKEFKRGGVSVLSSSYVNFFTGGKGIHSVPDHAQILFDRLLIPGEKAGDERIAIERLIEQLREKAIIDGRVKVRVSERLRPTPAGKPYFFSPNSALAKFVISAAKEVTPKVRLGIGRSVGDENRFAEKGIPVLIVSPHGSGSHTSDEWVDAESVYRTSRIFRQAIQRLDALEVDSDLFLGSFVEDDSFEESHSELKNDPLAIAMRLEGSF